MSYHDWPKDRDTALHILDQLPDEVIADVCALLVLVEDGFAIDAKIAPGIVAVHDKCVTSIQRSMNGTVQVVFQRRTT